MSSEAIVMIPPEVVRTRASSTVFAKASSRVNRDFAGIIISQWSAGACGRRQNRRDQRERLNRYTGSQTPLRRASGGVSSSLAETDHPIRIKVAQRHNRSGRASRNPVREETTSTCSQGIPSDKLSNTPPRFRCRIDAPAPQRPEYGRSLDRAGREVLSLFRTIT